MPLPCMSFATPSLPNRIAPTGFRCSPFGTSGHPAASTMQGVSAKYPRIGFGGTESACTKTRVRLTPFSYGRGRFHAGSGRCFPSPIRRSFGRAMHQVTQEPNRDIGVCERCSLASGSVDFGWIRQQLEQCPSFHLIELPAALLSDHPLRRKSGRFQYKSGDSQAAKCRGFFQQDGCGRRKPRAVPNGVSFYRPRTSPSPCLC